MSRLIDADKLAKRVANLEAVAIEQVLKYEPCDEYEKWKLWSAILNERTAFKFDLFDAPTVDAVEVVRCKDCKWWNGKKETCIEIGGLWRSLDFCSFGERREDGKVD